jgi:hypothetical protein
MSSPRRRTYAQFSRPRVTTPDRRASSAVESHAVASLQDVVVSHELLLRRIRTVNARAGIAAMHRLAGLLPEGAAIVLKRLA